MPIHVEQRVYKIDKAWEGILSSKNHIAKNLCMKVESTYNNFPTSSIQAINTPDFQWEINTPDFQKPSMNCE